MLKVFRIFAVIWLAGLVSVVFFNRVNLFRYAGVTRIDVFNTPSVLMTRWKFVYYKKVENKFIRMPFMLDSGADLSWMKDENMRYRTYFKMARLMRINEVSGKNFDQSLFETQETYLPMLYDLCASSEPSAEYLLNVINSAKQVTQLYKMTIAKSELPQKLSGPCKSIENLPKIFKKESAYLGESEMVIDTEPISLKPKWQEI